MRGGFRRWIPMRTGAQLPRGLHHDPPKFWIKSSLESPKHYRMRCTRLSHPRPIPEGVREPIYVRKKYIIWARWRPVPVKNVNYPRAPSSRRSGLVGPHTTPAIVNYKYIIGQQARCALPVRRRPMFAGLPLQRVLPELSRTRSLHHDADQEHESGAEALCACPGGGPPLKTNRAKEGFYFGLKI